MAGIARPRRALAPLLRPRGMVSLELQSNAKRDDSVPARHRYGPGSEGCATVDATTTVVAMEVLPSARKHGVSDEDIRHAYDNAIVAITTPDQPDFTMYVGPDGVGGSSRSEFSLMPTMTS